MTCCGTVRAEIDPNACVDRRGQVRNGKSKSENLDCSGRFSKAALCWSRALATATRRHSPEQKSQWQDLQVSCLFLRGELEFQNAGFWRVLKATRTIWLSNTV